jgi:hypothetical protein
MRIAGKNGNISVQRGTNGSRRIEIIRPNHSRIVSLARNRGFVERQIPSRPGYVSRSYVVDGKSLTRVYRTHTYQSLPTTSLFRQSTIRLRFTTG